MTTIAREPGDSSIDAHPLSKVAGAAAILIGLAALAGGKLPGFKDTLSALGGTNAHSAPQLMLLGVALALGTSQAKSRWPRRLSLVAALLVAICATVSLVEYALDFDIQTWGFAPWRNTVLDAGGRAHLSVAAAAGFLMLSTVLLLLPSKGAALRRLIEVCILATLLIAAPALVEFAYGFDSFDIVAPQLSVTLCVASTFLLLCLGVLYARNDFEIMRPIRSAQLGGLLARQMLPAVLGIPLLFGWVRLVEVRQLGENGFEIGLTIHTLTTIIVFCVLIWLTARSMNALDAQREQAKNAEQKMRLLSETCPLTGALNRRSLDDRLMREWNRAMRHGRPLSAIMLDVDRFKQINDAHGHAAGDAILKRLATILKDLCRPMDLVCRYGGDEFCVLLPDTTEIGATALAERFCAMLQASLVHFNGQAITLSGSFGVATRSVEMDRPSCLINLADQALLAAKRSGRNCVICASWLSISNNFSQIAFAAAPVET